MDICLVVGFFFSFFDDIVPFLFTLPIILLVRSLLYIGMVFSSKSSAISWTPYFRELARSSRLLRGALGSYAALIRIVFDY